MAVEVADGDAAGQEAVVGDADRIGDAKVTIVTDEGTVADDDLGVGIQAMAETEGGFAGEADVVADDDASAAGQVGERFHLEASSDGGALAAEKRFVPEESQAPDAGFARGDVELIKQSADRAYGEVRAEYAPREGL